MAVKLDAARDYYLANAGFECEPGSFRHVWDSYADDLNAASCDADINEAYNRCMDAMRSLPIDKPKNPIRIGIVGELDVYKRQILLGANPDLVSVRIDVHLLGTIDDVSESQDVGRERDDQDDEVDVRIRCV